MATVSAAPNMFVLGAPKCGTHTLHYDLGQHPEIFMTVVKEARFFNIDRHYAEGFAQYLSTHFSNTGDCPIRGEASPGYLRHHDKVIARMKAHLDPAGLKFIVILRDPVARAWSHYLHNRRTGHEDLPFPAALEQEAHRAQERPDAWLGYVRDGLYGEQLARWFDGFPRESFFVAFTDELAANQADLLARLCTFLGVDSSFAFTKEAQVGAFTEPRFRFVRDALRKQWAGKGLLKAVLPGDMRRGLRHQVERANETPSKAPQLDPATAEQLRATFREDVERLEAILGLDLARWKPPDAAAVPKTV